MQYPGSLRKKEGLVGYSQPGDIYRALRQAPRAPRSR
jgi:hypothetical protein